MFELMTSDDRGATWTRQDVFADLEPAKDAARQAWIFSETAAVFEDGEIVFEWPTPRGQIDGELPRWPVEF